MNRILITGGAGFIGSNLIRHLLDDGQRTQDIRVLTPPWEDNTKIINLNVEIVVGDIRDKTATLNATKNIDTIYHLASKIGHDGGDYNYFKDTIVDGTKNLVTSAKKNKIKKFILFSSTGVYGLPATAGNISGFNEKSSKNFSEGYGQAKYESEGCVIASNIPYLIIRPTTVYGPDDHGGVTQLINFLKSMPPVLIGDAQNKMDYIYVKDLVRVVRQIEKSRIINEDFIVGSGTPITQFELISTICKILGKPSPSIHIPTMAALILSSIIKYMYEVIGKNPPVFPNRIRVLSSDYYFDITKLKRLIGYKPQYSFQRGVQELLSI